MKRLLLTLLCLAGAGSHSQDYIPLLNDSKWYINMSHIGLNETFWVYPVSDTIIEGTEYMNYMESFNVDGTDYENHYYIREDIEERRIYKMDWNGERLLYDFSLEVGENVTLDLEGEPVEYTVVARDSFAVDTGRKRVMLFLEDVNGWYSGQEMWVEGMGNWWHPFKNLHYIIPDPSYVLHCHYQQEELVYSFGIDECPQPPLIITNFTITDIKIFPNPFLSSFILKSGEYLDNTTLTCMI